MRCSEKCSYYVGKEVTCKDGCFLDIQFLEAVKQANTNRNKPAYARVGRREVLNKIRKLIKKDLTLKNTIRRNISIWLPHQLKPLI